VRRSLVGVNDLDDGADGTVAELDEVAATAHEIPVKGKDKRVRMNHGAVVAEEFVGYRCWFGSRCEVDLCRAADDRDYRHARILVRIFPLHFLVHVQQVLAGSAEPTSDKILQDT
jgi:hypothetical protein